MRIDDLKPFVDKTVIIRMNDGEIAKVKVSFINEEDEDLMAVVVESSCADRYRGACALHTFAASDIGSIELSE